MSLSVCLSLRMEHIDSHWTDFHEILYFNIFFRKFVDKIKVCLKSDKIKGTFHEDIRIFTTASRWTIFRMRNVSDKICRENKKNKVTFFFLKSCRLLGNVKKYCRSGQVTDGNMIRLTSFILYTLYYMLHILYIFLWILYIFLPIPGVLSVTYVFSLPSYTSLQCKLNRQHISAYFSNHHQELFT